MSHVDFKKWPCRRVEFRGQGPHYTNQQVLGVREPGALPWTVVVHPEDALATPPAVMGALGPATSTRLTVVGRHVFCKRNSITGSLFPHHCV